MDTEQNYNYTISLLLFLEKVLDDPIMEEMVTDIHANYEKLYMELRTERDKNV